MRVCLLIEPGQVPPPPEMMPKIIAAFGHWREKWRAKMEVFDFWAGRPGGLGIANVANETELSQMMMEFPFGPFSHIDVRPIVNGDEALKRLGPTMAEMMSKMMG